MKHSCGILGLLLLTGCAATPPPAPAAPDLQGAYIKVMRAVFPSPVTTDAQLIDMGHKACDSFDETPDFSQQQAAFVRAGMTESQSKVFVIASVRTYCPQWGDKLPLT
ncbi:MAG: DUF732 domain-containing protein [Actinomycetota bacterium]|nr:DUF732 domain-containing protein [Actinomycetota bacterium]